MRQRIGAQLRPRVQEQWHGRRDLGDRRRRAKLLVSPARVRRHAFAAPEPNARPTTRAADRLSAPDPAALLLQSSHRRGFALSSKKPPVRAPRKRAQGNAVDRLRINRSAVRRHDSCRDGGKRWMPGGWSEGSSLRSVADALYGRRSWPSMSIRRGCMRRRMCTSIRISR